MWALVEDNEITKIINKPKGLVIGDTRHSRKIFEYWSKEEKEAIGIYEIIFDNSNKKDEEYYNNTNQSFDYSDGEVIASYGSATPKALTDILWTQEDSDNEDLPDDKEIGDVKEVKEQVKAIGYSVLYMKAIKALQEAQTRIEELETKVKA